MHYSNLKTIGGMFMTKCENCGVNLENGDIFCTYCWAEMNDMSEEE